MGFYKIIIFILIVISLASFFCKIYLQMRIRHPEKKISFFSIFIRFYTLADLLPMRLKLTDTKERALRKKANIALAVFYSSFILVQVISIIIARSGRS